MVITERIAKLLQKLWSSSCKNPNMEPDSWLPLLSLLLGNKILINSSYYTDRSINEFITLGKVDDLVIYYSKSVHKVKPLIKEFNKSINLFAHHKCSKILILTPSLTGINLVYFSVKKDELLYPVKIIHLPQGRLPTYFQEIIKAKSGQNRSLELLNELFDVSKLETDFLVSMRKCLRSKSELQPQMIGNLTILLLSSFISDSLGLLYHSPNITFQDFFIRIKEFKTQQVIKNSLISKLEGIFKELRLNSFQIDIASLKDLLQRYPFSLNENGVFIQEIAINPSSFSEITEILPGSNSKKKGKYYTSSANAEFISYLAVYRLLSNKLTSIKSDDLFNWVYNDWGLMEDNINISTDHLSVPALRILDPACGTGTFLLSVSRLFYRLTNPITRNFPRIELIGIDPDEMAVFITRIRLTFLEICELLKFSSESSEEEFSINWSFVNIIQGDFFNHKEIYEKKYDLILGNPPWVRHEDIGIGQPPEYKKLIQSQIRELSNTTVHIDRKSDLYIYFCLLGLSLLNENGGILAFLTSNAWLEVKYGQTLQRFLLDSKQFINFDIIYRSGRRLWKNLGVNSIIFIVEKSSANQEKAFSGIFTETKIDFPHIPLSSLRNGLIPRSEFKDQFYRTEKIQKKLLQKTHKWAGTFLRMSHVERKIIHLIQKKGVSLSNLADIRFGIKTGANDFFHLQCFAKKRADKKVQVKNRLGYEGLVEEKYIVPLIKSPSHVNGFVISDSFIPNVWLFYCLDSPSKLQGSGAWTYIKWGENTKIIIKQGKKSGNRILGFSSVRSVTQREYWYSIGSYPIPSLLWTKSYHDKSGCFYNQAEILPDQRFYGINVNQNEYLPLIFTFLNSSIVWAQMEAQGNTNMGFGVLDTNVYWLRDLKIPVDAMVEQNQIKALMDKLILEQNRVSMLDFSKIRTEIDHFYAKYLDLSENSMTLLYEFISRSIKNRLQ